MLHIYDEGLCDGNSLSKTCQKLVAWMTSYFQTHFQHGSYFSLLKCRILSELIRILNTCFIGEVAKNGENWQLVTSQLIEMENN